MSELWDSLLQFMNNERGLAIFRAIVVVVGGYFIAWGLSRATVRAARAYLDPQREMVVRRGVFYAIFVLSIVTAMNDLGFKFSTLLGAAGILSVAIGFASQTSMSNLISGLFLIGEQSFKVGDTIQVGTTMGEVLSVDLLSVKLRTFDNLFVRLPNEQMIKSEVTNLSRFAIRRVDLALRVSIGSDISLVESTLLKVVDDDPLSLIDPTPRVLFQTFGPSEINVDLRAWVRREDYLQFRSETMRQVKEAFEQAGIEIPIPHRALIMKEAAPHPVLERSESPVAPQVDK